MRNPKNSQKNQNKNTMDHIDFSFLDIGFPILESNKVAEIYKHYKGLYDLLRENLKNNGGWEWE